MNATTVLTHFSIDEGCLFVLFVTLRSPKPQWFQPHSWHCWKALHEYRLLEFYGDDLVILNQSAGHIEF
jgi:hypothetical protein